MENDWVVSLQDHPHISRLTRRMHGTLHILVYKAKISYNDVI